MAIDRWLRLAALLASLSPACAASSERPAPAATAPAASGWSERGVFVLGSLVFDIRGSFFRAGPFVGRIEDCSNSEFYCLRTLDFELVLPRNCGAIAVGDVWRVGEAETHVLHYDTSGVLPRAYLGNPNRRSIVYHYGVNGVGAIYWDYTGQNDLVALAAAGSIEGWFRGSAVRHQIYNELITFDSFGPCR